VTTERDDYGRQIAMTSDVDATAAATIVDPHAAGRVHHVPEEAVHPAVVDAWQHDRGSTHQQIKARIRSTGSTGEHQRALDRRNLALEDRIVRARHAAKLSSINVSPELRAFRAAQKRNKTPEHLEALAQRIEDKANRREVLDAA
jgi:hypothetical protein